MRILTFTSLFPNAADKTLGVFIYQRMAHVARRSGNQVQVVAPVPYVPSWLPLARWKSMSRVPRVEQAGELTVYHPRYFLLPKVSMYVHGLLIFLGSFLLVRRLHRQARFDCVDAHYVYPDGLAAALCGKLLRLPVFVSARGTDINLFPSYRGLRPMIRWTLRQTAGNIAVCKALADEMTALGAPGKVAVIGNGIDLDRFQPLDRGASRQALGLPAGMQMVVAVGALIPRKGYHFLIPALAFMAKDHPALRVYIVGQGSQRAELEALARTAQVEDRLVFTGNRPNEELNLWFSAADVSCLVSSREGWPNVVLESLASGTPVVATGLWGVPEILVSPGLGIMVEQESGAIARGLTEALARSWDREAIVRYARLRTWDVVAGEVEDYLGKTLQIRAGTEAARPT